MSEQNLEIQANPTVDSPATDPFEALVAAYYQYKGYLTSSAKWFWVRDLNKQQRGYQDIDVLAVNESETIIISVSGNLDDKVRFSRGGKLNTDILDNQLRYFSRVRLYLKTVEEYQWLISNRKIRHVIAYANGKSLANRLEEHSEWLKYNIELLYSGEILQEIQAIMNNPEIGAKTNNQIIKLLQIISATNHNKVE